MRTSPIRHLIISTAAFLRSLRNALSGGSKHAAGSGALDIAVSWKDEAGRVSWSPAAGDIMALAAGRQLEREGGAEIRIWEGPAVYTVTQYALLLETGDPDGVIWNDQPSQQTGGTLPLGGPFSTRG
jgi:hypothetical protein